jgi:hypothetical protein
MRGLEENEMYSLFKVRLTNPEKNAFSNDSWDKMEALLNERSGRDKAVTWLYRLSSGIAATSLLFAMFYFLRPVTPVINKIAKTSAGQLRKLSSGGKTNGRRKQPGVVQQNKELRQLLLTVDSKHLPKRSNGVAQAQPKAIIPIVSYLDTVREASPDLTVSNSKKIFADSASLLFAATLPAIAPATGIQSPRTEKVIKIAQKFSHQLALSALAAPDINSVNGFNSSSRAGANFGLQFSIQLSKRISISSGVFYASKPYQTSTANYKPQTANWWSSKFGGTGKPDQVTADCKVLDVPLNVSYLVFSQGANKLSFGTGLSSYFMLSEAYRFNFDDPSVNSANFDINNRNKHLFGLINLNTTYERKANSRFSIILQPYIKLPITQIGFGQVNLRSTGIAAGLNWNINPSKAR